MPTLAAGKLQWGAMGVLSLLPRWEEMSKIRFSKKIPASPPSSEELISKFCMHLIIVLAAYEMLHLFLTQAIAWPQSQCEIKEKTNTWKITNYDSNFVPQRDVGWVIWTH